MNKYPEAVSLVKQVCKILNDTENLAGCTPAEVGERSQWIFIVNSTEENKANFCKVLDGKPLFGTLYMYTVTLNELKAILKVSAQAGQSGSVNKTLVESMAQDNFWEVKTCKRDISNNTSQIQNKSLYQSQHPQLSICLQKQC
jgi:hypothetical protein